MKKILLTAVLGLVSLICFPCSGTYYAKNQEEARSIRDQFNTNCCKNRTIKIYNLETGLGASITSLEDGLNSSCAYAMVE